MATEIQGGNLHTRAGYSAPPAQQPSAPQGTGEAPQAANVASGEQVTLSSAAAAQAGSRPAGPSLPTGRPAEQVLSRGSSTQAASGTSWTDGLPEPLKKMACVFEEMGKRYNVDPRFLAAVSMHETAHGTSYAYKHKNNAMGICGNGGTKRFQDVADSVEASARALADRGLYGSATTIRDIGARYAPHGAANDPNGLNNSWVGGVTQNYRRLGGDPSQPVVQR